ncbi:MAG: hypothetical protein ACRENX_03770 [Candidatus Dormibacteria bacterium]
MLSDRLSTFEYEGAPRHALLETTTILESSCGAKLTTQTVFQPAGDRDQMVAAGMEYRDHESIQRPGDFLAPQGERPTH